MEIYVHPTCTSCKKAERLLKEFGVDVLRRDYFRDPFTSDELKDVFSRAGVTPPDMLSTKSTAYRELGLADREVTSELLLNLMPGNPTLIKRPLIIGKAGSTTGFDAGKISALIAGEG
ncbi:MAG: Spx/MgsR family RNA polymerase-binding regulatory protein [Thermomicrobiales bacterium]